MGDDRDADVAQENDDQNKTTPERVEEQKVETKEVAPNKTGDVKPNR
jgi:hypothetical protein